MKQSTPPSGNVRCEAFPGCQFKSNIYKIICVTVREWKSMVNLKKINETVHEIMVGNLSANQMAAPKAKVGQMCCYANQF